MNDMDVSGNVPLQSSAITWKLRGNFSERQKIVSLLLLYGEGRANQRGFAFVKALQSKNLLCERELEWLRGKRVRKSRLER